MPRFFRFSEAAYQTAVKAGRWKGKYAAENRSEYWAEAVQSWLDTNRENDDLHNHVDTREELIEYDPAVAELCRQVFGGFGGVKSRSKKSSTTGWSTTPKPPTAGPSPPR